MACVGEEFGPIPAYLVANSTAMMNTGTRGLVDTQLSLMVQGHHSLVLGSEIPRLEAPSGPRSSALDCVVKV